MSDFFRDLRRTVGDIRGTVRSGTRIFTDVTGVAKRGNRDLNDLGVDDAKSEFQETRYGARTIREENNGIRYMTEQERLITELQQARNHYGGIRENMAGAAASAGVARSSSGGGSIEFPDEVTDQLRNTPAVKAYFERQGKDSTDNGYLNGYVLGIGQDVSDKDIQNAWVEILQSTNGRQLSAAEIGHLTGRQLAMQDQGIASPAQSSQQPTVTISGQPAATQQQAPRQQQPGQQPASGRVMPASLANSPSVTSGRGFHQQSSGSYTQDRGEIKALQSMMNLVAKNNNIQQTRTDGMYGPDTGRLVNQLRREWGMDSGSHGRADASFLNRLQQEVGRMHQQGAVISGGQDVDTVSAPATAQQGQTPAHARQ